jgi:hypothetical protein
MVDMIIRSNETWIASIHMKNMLHQKNGLLSYDLL